MKKLALFTSNNLIGDGIYISQALNKWHQNNPDHEIWIQTLNDHVQTIYKGMPGVKEVITEDLSADWNFKHTFDVTEAFQLSDKKKIHIAEAYAELLGIRLEPEPKNRHLKPLYNPPALFVEPELRDLTLVSMFSNSCTSRERDAEGNLVNKPPNKMLPWVKWRPIINFIEERFGNVKFLGAPSDRMDWLKIREEQYLTGIPLPKLARIMQYAKLLITVDNGMSHLAASQEVPTFLFYPVVLGAHYIVPHGNPYMNFVHMNPVTLETDKVIAIMRRAIPNLIQMKSVEVKAG